uniref:Uncharacterized protein n=1 Tax=Pavo cristatus TaxID=9049 RepID=A0A8C9FZD9_PAVCR
MHPLISKQRCRLGRKWLETGGMRIVQKHPHSSDTKEEKDKDDQDWETSSYNCTALSLQFAHSKKKLIKSEHYSCALVRLTYVMFI